MSDIRQSERRENASGFYTAHRRVRSFISFGISSLNRNNCNFFLLNKLLFCLETYSIEHDFFLLFKTHVSKEYVTEVKTMTRSINISKNSFHECRTSVSRKFAARCGEISVWFTSRTVVTVNYHMLILSGAHDVCIRISIVTEPNGDLISDREQKLMGVGRRRDEKNRAQSAVSRASVNFVGNFGPFVRFDTSIMHVYRSFFPGTIGKNNLDIDW